MTFNKNDYEELYWKLNSKLPRLTTDRISDLNRLLQMESSSVLYSLARDGTTTLMKEYSRKKEGIYLDCGSLPTKDTLETLDTLLGDAEKPAVLDETASLFRRSTAAEEYLQNLAKKRQIVARIHPWDKEYLLKLSQNGFTTINIGKITYQEFSAGIQKQFAEVGFDFPERLIKSAHDAFPILCLSTLYIAQVFRWMLDGKSFSEEEVKKEVEETNHFLLKYLEKISKKI